MNRQRFRHRSCLGKRRYRDAHSAAKAMAHRVRRGAPYLRKYECDFCSGWHITKLRIDTPFREAA